MSIEKILHMMKCPDCDGQKIVRKSSQKLQCQDCMREYSILDNGIIQMYIPEKIVRPEIYEDPEFKKWSKVKADALTQYFENENWLFNKIHHSGHKYLSKWRNDVKEINWIVDIGCGGGAHYPYYKDLDNVVGIDLNIDSLNEVKEKYPNAILIQGDMCNLPLIDDTVSAIMSIYVLEHIYYLDEAVSEMKRIVQPGKPVFVGLPTEGGFAWNYGRKITSVRTLSKRYNIDYRKVISIEHCNTAKKIINSLKKYFKVDKLRFFPFLLFPFISFNLIIALKLSQIPDEKSNK
jgi:ubiquinone/menaquinone biosynthesis C-methylase UbiE/uncharacterized protein YbaR (Trm112 family)